MAKAQSPTRRLLGGKLLPRLSSYFHAWAKGWSILALVAALVLFAAITLPIAQAASGTTVALDTRLYYTPEEAFSAVASYSDDGREVLRIFYLTADIVNPLLYASILALLLSWLFQRGFEPASFMQKLNALPVGAAIFDLWENISVVILLSAYPAQPRMVAWLAAAGTTTKYIFIYASFVLVLVGLVAAALKWFRRQ